MQRIKIDNMNKGIHTNGMSNLKKENRKQWNIHDQTNDGNNVVVDLGIKRTPLEQWMQTVAMVFFLFLVLQLMLGINAYVLYHLLYYTKEWWFVTSLYAVWWAYDYNTCNTGGRRWNWLRNLFIWKYTCNYFPIRLVKTADLDPNRNYICGSHPHGLCCMGVGQFALTPHLQREKVFPDIYFRMLAHRELYFFPGLREFMLGMGLSAATKENLDAILGNMHEGRRSTGQATIVVVGGSREVISADTTDRIVLSILKRKGFIVKALQYGADLVPMFTFNKAFLANPMFFTTFVFPTTCVVVWEWLVSTIQCPLPYFIGRGIFLLSFGLLPKRLPLTVVVGKPINVEEFGIPRGGCQPTQKQVDNVHAAYLKALRDIYDQYNPIYGRKHTPLVFG